MLGDVRCRDEPGQAVQRVPHVRHGSAVSPPIETIGFNAVLLAYWVDAFLQPSEWLAVQCRVAFRHAPSEVDDPLTGGSAGQVHAVYPRLQDVGVGPTVRVGWQAEPLSCQIARNVEGATFLVTFEGDAGVRRQTLSMGEIDAGDAAPCRQVSVDLVHGLAVEPS